MNKFTLCPYIPLKKAGLRFILDYIEIKAVLDYNLPFLSIHQYQNLYPLENQRLKLSNPLHLNYRQQFFFIIIDLLINPLIKPKLKIKTLLP